MSIQAVLFLLFLCAVVFYAGWWACKHWHAKPAPSPLYRDVCAVQMNDRRLTVSEEIGSAFACGHMIGFREGFTTGQLSKPRRLPTRQPLQRLSA